MAGLAQLLLRRGVAVSGSSDGPGPADERLRVLGVSVHAGHAPAHLPKGARLLIHAPGVPVDHPDRLRAARRGVPETSLPGMLGLWVRPRLGVAFLGPRVAGLAAAMVGWTLARAGLDPTVVINSPAPQLGGSGRAGSGPHCVMEVGRLADPGQLGPSAAVAFGRPAGPVADRDFALRRLAVGLPAGGFLLAPTRHIGLRKALDGLESQAPVEWFSTRRSGSCWWGADLREDRGRYRFRVFRRGRFVVEVTPAVPGRVAVMAALAGVAACVRLGVPTAAIKDGLEEFRGVARHLEPRGSYRGATLVDDGSDSGRSVGRVLSVCRQVHGRRRLLAAFQPGRLFRTTASVDRMACALGRADRVWIVAGPGSGALLTALKAAGMEARGVADVDDAIGELDQHLEPGDVLVTLGAGDVGKVADAFSRRLPGNRPGR